jgi:hypothetical protein
VFHPFHHARSLVLVTFAVLGAAPSRLPAQAVLQITSPTNGAIVNPGQTMVVDVSVSGTVLATARITAQDPIKSVQVLIAPPYQFSITIPSKIRPGPYTLVAEGTSVSSAVPSSDPVSIDVERMDTPLSIAAGPALQLAIGEHSNVRVDGTYSDGSVVDLSRSTQTTYDTDPAGIVSVTKEGLVTGLAGGSTSIVIHHQNYLTVVKAVVPAARK